MYAAKCRAAGSSHSQNGEIKGHEAIVGYGGRTVYGTPGMPGPPMTQLLTQFQYARNLTPNLPISWAA